MSEPTTKVAFLGAGDVSPLHAAAVAGTPGAVLRGLWSKDGGAARAKEFGCREYPSADALLADEAVDAVFVLTPLETHAEYAERALAAGKHVLVEKPAGRTPQEIAAMAQAARTAGKLCVPVHNYVHDSSLERTVRLLREGSLGKIVHLSIQYHIHHPDAVRARYPGVIRQILTHHAYVLLRLAGMPTELVAMKSTMGDPAVPQEDLASVTLRLRDGGLAHLCADFAADDHSADPWTFVVKLIGTEGATRYSYRDHVQNRPGAVHSHTFSAYPETIANCVRHFLERCVRRGEEPLSTLEDAERAAALLEACERSIAERRAVEL